jgi:restriction system protein
MAKDMGGIWLSRVELLTTASEIVGRKSGLALNRHRVYELTPNESAEIWSGPDEAMIRVRSEEFEQLVADLLFRVGNIPSPSISPAGVRLFHKYKKSPEKLAIFQDVLGIFPEEMTAAMDEAVTRGTKSIDPTHFVERSEGLHGVEGALIALEFVGDVDQQMHRNPWSTYRRVEWKDMAELEDLYRSESLTTLYGEFFDQRFIDFLGANFPEIDNMNWRKFEGLAAEFFSRAGFRVEVGPGRNDNGVDLRLSPEPFRAGAPPTVLVQCKRQNRVIEKVIVKSLYADVLAEKAESGLIVTTSALSPGARAVCTARAYPVSAAGRSALKGWISAMRTPDAGVFLGE